MSFTGEKFVPLKSGFSARVTGFEEDYRHVSAEASSFARLFG